MATITLGKFRKNATYNWYCDESGSDLRFWVIAVLLGTFMSYYGFQLFYAQSATLKSFTTVASNYYKPAYQIQGTMIPKELAVVKITDVKKFASLDVPSALHTVELKRNDKDGLDVNHIIKPTDNSTHYFSYSEGIPVRPYSFWFEARPISVLFEGKQPIIIWQYESKHEFMLWAVLMVISFSITHFLNKSLDKYLRRRWTDKICQNES